MKKNDKNKKPNKIKIDLAFSNCKDSINELLNDYQGKIDAHYANIVELKREKRFDEADRCKDRLKLVLGRQASMQDLLDQVEQFNFMIDEAFAKSAVYNSIGTVMGETNKLSVDPEVKSILKNFRKFDVGFTKGVGKMDLIFGKVAKKIAKIDAASMATQDKEIDAIVNARLAKLDEQATEEAGIDEETFKLK